MHGLESEGIIFLIPKEEDKHSVSNDKTALQSKLQSLNRVVVIHLTQSASMGVIKS